MTFPHSPPSPEPRAGRVVPPVTQATVESGWGEKSTTAAHVSPSWCRTALHECPKLPLTSKWSPCWCLQSWSPPPTHGSIVLQCLTVFVPSAKEGPQSMQRRLHCIYLSLQSRLEMVAYIALVQTDRHTNRHRHMLERVSLPFESVCWNQRWNQRYDNLATKPRRQCSALWAALRVLWFTGHVDIPPIALTHTRRHTLV